MWIFHTNVGLVFPIAFGQRNHKGEVVAIVGPSDFLSVAIDVLRNVGSDKLQGDVA